MVETCRGEIILLKIEEDIPIEYLEELYNDIVEIFKRKQEEIMKRIKNDS